MADVSFQIEWDKTGEKFYQTGTDRGVIYPISNSGTYPKGYGWNGLTGVSESPSGAEVTKLWADNINYLNLMSAEEFGFTITAYMYPDEFAECDGSAEIETGVKIGQQDRKRFGFVYRTKIGNDVDGDAKGYKIHCVYGCQAKPSSKDFKTVNDSPEAIELSWECTATPVSVTNFKPTCVVEIDSTKLTAAQLTAIETVLYGTAASGAAAVDARLPLPDEIATIISEAA